MLYSHSWRTMALLLHVALLSLATTVEMDHVKNTIVHKRITFIPFYWTSVFFWSFWICGEIDGFYQSLDLIKKTHHNHHTKKWFDFKKKQNLFPLHLLFQDLLKWRLWFCAFWNVRHSFDWRRRPYIKDSNQYVICVAAWSFPVHAEDHFMRSAIKP